MISRRWDVLRKFIYVSNEVMESWSTNEVCSFIAEKDFEKDVVELFRVNRIRGPVLSLLTDTELKELGVTALGDRKLLLKLFQHASTSSETSCSTRNNEKVHYNLRLHRENSEWWLEIISQ